MSQNQFEAKYTNWEARDRLRRHTGMNIEYAITCFEEGALTREDLILLAHDYCEGLPIHTNSFAKKMEVALRIGVISFEDYVGRMREFHLYRAAQKFDDGLDEGFLSEEECGLAIDTTEEFVRQFDAWDSDFEWRHLDRIAYANRNYTDVRRKAFSLFLAARCEGLYDPNFEDDSEDADRIHFSNFAISDETYREVLKRLREKGFILPSRLEKISEEDRPYYCRSFDAKMVADYYQDFLSWLNYERPEIYDRYLSWVKNHKKRYSRKLEERLQKESEKSLTFDPYFDPY